MMDSLSRSDPAPLHLQLRKALIALIEDLQLKPGDQFPTESVLWERFQVSRQTLRQAVDSLVRDHILYRQHPKGTFVGFGAVEGDLQVLRSVWEDIRRLGMEPSTRVINVCTVGAGDIAPFLNVDPQSRLLELQRVFFANGEPISFDTAYFPLPEFQWMQEVELDGSWYELVESRMGISLSHARTVVEASLATKKLSAHLQTREGDPLLTVRRQTFVQGDPVQRSNPIAYTVASYRADRYQFAVILSRR